MHLCRIWKTNKINCENLNLEFELPFISIHTQFELLAPHSISIVKVSSATLPQGVVGWRQVTTTRRSQVSRLVAIQGVPSQSYVQRCFWPAPVQHHHGYERPFSRMGPSCPMVGVYVRWNCPSLIKSGCGAWWWNWCGGRRMRSTLWQGQSCKAFSVGLPDIKVSPLSWILRHTCEFIWNGLILLVLLVLLVHSFAWNILYLLITSNTESRVIA